MVRSGMFAAVAALLLIGTGSGAQAEGDGDSNNTSVLRLSGFREVPAIVTSGRGTARLKIRGQSIQYELVYSNLEGGQPTAAHIHVGQDGVNGGVAAFLCGGGGTPNCPAPGVKVSGTVTSVVGPAGQGVDTIADLIAAIRAGTAYVNVHNATYPTGEIRGDVKP